MESKSYLDKSTSSHTRKTVEVEVPGVYSGVMDFEFSHLIGKKGKAVVAVILGNIVEWYDYAIYGYMSVILSAHFFSTPNPSNSLFRYFLVFALGFLARPFGSIIFGSIGDSYGRKYALRWSIIGVALPTVLIGCLPSYGQIGSISIFLLCLFRVAQGIFISAESDGVSIFIYETMPKLRACTVNSITWISSSLGVGLASFAASMVCLPNSSAWAWRLPFFFSGILCLITLWYRRHLIESYDFAHHMANRTISSEKSFSGFLTVISCNKAKILLALMIEGSVGGTYYFYFVFWNSYLCKILNIIPASEAAFNATLFVVMRAIIAPVCGYIADRSGILSTVRFSGLLCLLLLIGNGLSLHFLNTVPTSLMVITSVMLVLFGLPSNVLWMKMFGINERYRCMSMAHALGSVIFTSTAPAISIFMWQKFQHSTAPLFYCGFLLLMGFIATLFLKEKGGQSIELLNDSSLNYELKKNNHSNPIGCSTVSCKKT
jgi:MHS family proline/betaine transporter-like MFS transporter